MISYILLSYCIHWSQVNEDMVLIVEISKGVLGIERHQILSDVNLEIYQGEFCYLTGRSGTGKSTLLKTLYAAHPLIGGSAEVAGFSLSALTKDSIPDLRRKIGMVFQDFKLFPNWTVKRNLSYVLEATGWTDREQAYHRVEEVLNEVGLLSKIDEPAYALSGGEQQRLCVARATLNKPALIIADEPTGNLDAQTSDEIFELFKHINLQLGTAIIFATHDQRLKNQYPARTLVCVDGTLREE